MTTNVDVVALFPFPFKFIGGLPLVIISFLRNMVNKKLSENSQLTIRHVFLYTTVTEAREEEWKTSNSCWALADPNNFHGNDSHTHI